MFSSKHRVHYQLRQHKRDELIEFIKTLLLTPFVMYGKNEADKSAIGTLRTSYKDTFSRVEELVENHRQHIADGSPSASQLKELVPSIGTFFTPLPLAKAFELYDDRMALSGRLFVPPSFNDIRHILSTAQILSVRDTLRLATFDGDETLYSDGHNFDRDSKMVKYLITLLERGVNVALVTAAGYKGKPARYEQRLQGLLDGFRDAKVSEETLSRFFVMGGECNFLFRCNADYKLVEIAAEDFHTAEQREWSEDKIQQLLDLAEQSILSGIQRMKLQMQVYRKPRAVGTIRPDEHFKPGREQLDELALSCRHALASANTGLPFCAFNGGSDVWIDIGNKLLGVQALQQYLNCKPAETVHFGDQFLSTGNDISTRHACCTVWVASPSETQRMLQVLVDPLPTEGAAGATAAAHAAHASATGPTKIPDYV